MIIYQVVNIHHDSQVKIYFKKTCCFFVSVIPATATMKAKIEQKFNLLTICWQWRTPSLLKTVI